MIREKIIQKSYQKIYHANVNIELDVWYYLEVKNMIQLTIRLNILEV